MLEIKPGKKAIKAVGRHRFKGAGHNHFHSDEVRDQAYEPNLESSDQDRMVR